MPAWRKANHSRRRISVSTTPAHGVGRVFAWLLILTLLLILFVLIMQRQWRGTGQRTVALVHQASDPVRRPLTLVVSDPRTGKSIIMPLDATQKVSLLNREVRYSTDALVGFTQLEKLDWGYLRLLLALEYGVAIDGLIWVPAAPVQSWATVRWWATRALWQRWPSSLTYWDRLTWWRRTWQQSSADGVVIQPTADFSQDGQLNTTKYDTWAGGQVRDIQIQHSRMSVAVWNASGEQGLAGRFSRLLTLMGYEVRSIDTVEPARESQIIMSPPPAPEEISDNQRWARRRLTETLPQFTVKIDTDTTRRTRTEAVVILGQDMIEMYR